MKRFLLVLLLWPVFAFGQQQVPVVSGVVSIPAASGNSSFSVILTENVTSFSITPPAPYQAPPSITVLFIQDATGGRTVSGYASNILNTSSISVDSAANATTGVQFTYNANGNSWTALGGGVPNPLNTVAIEDKGGQVYNVKAYGGWGAAVTASNCKGTILIPTGYAATISADPFSGYHTSNVCQGETLIGGNSTITTNAQIIVPDKYTIAGLGSTSPTIIAGASFPVGNTVASGQASRTSNVVTATLGISQTYPVGTVLSFIGFTSINGYCVVVTSSGTSLTCDQHGSDVASDGGGTVTMPLVVEGDTMMYTSPTGNSLDLWLQNLTLDCNNTAHTTGIYSDDLNELSGGSRLGIYGCVDDGIRLQADNVGVPSNFKFDTVNINMSTSASATSTGIRLYGIAGRSEIDNVTALGVTTTIQAGIFVDHGSGALIQNIHCETSTNCVELGVGSGENAVKLVVGSSSITNLAEIDSGAGGYQYLAQLYANGATNTLNNGDKGLILTAGTSPFIGLYDFISNSICTSTEPAARCLSPNSPMSFGSAVPCDSTTEGATQSFTDSTTNTWGAVISGGGSDHVLGYCDGANWVVAAP